jgi:hypothetical protein
MRSLVLPLLQGLGQSLDPKVAPSGMLETAKNAVPTKTGRLGRRAGYVRGPTSSMSSGIAVTIANTTKVWEHRGANGITQEMIASVRDGAGTATYTSAHPDAGTAIHVKTGSYYEVAENGRFLASVGVSDRTLLGDGALYSGYFPSASFQNYDLVAFPTKAGSFHAVLYRDGKEVLSFDGPASVVADVRVWRWATTAQLCVGWHNTTDHKLYYQYVIGDTRSVSSVAQLGTLVIDPTTEFTVTFPSQAWDVIGLPDSTSYPESCAVLAKTGSTSALQLLNTAGSGIPVTLTHASSRLCALGTYGDTLACLTGDSTGVEVQFVALGTLAITTTSLGTFVVMPIHGSVCYSPWFSLVALTTIGASSETNEKTTFYRVSGTSFIAHTEMGVRLASTFFSETKSVLCWVTYNHSTSFQRARYLLSLELTGSGAFVGTTRSLVARVGWGSAWDSDELPLPRPTMSNAGRFVSVFQEVIQGPLNVPASCQFGAYRYDTTVQSNERLGVAQLAGSNLGGGLPLHYDGKRVCEQGWLQYPPWVSHSPNAGTAGIPAGTYYYVAVYEETDALGNLHQSAPSPIYTMTLGSDVASVTLTALSPARTMRTSNVKVAFYRTTSGGTLLRRIGEVSSTDFVGTVAQLTDATTDAVLEAREALRSAAGELEECSPPGGYAITAHGRRVFLGAGDDLWFTKEYVTGFAHGWSAANVVKMPAPIRALASTGDALVILGESDCWMLWGEGPDRLGTGYYGAPVWVAAVGCPSARGGSRACAQTSIGVVWRGDAGMFLLPRGAGAPLVFSGEIEDLLTTYPITTAIVDDPEARCLHVHLATTETVGAVCTQAVYWYGLPTPIWTEHNNSCLGVHSAAMVGGNHVYASSSYTNYGVYTSTAGQTSDAIGSASAAVALTIKTRPVYPWGREVDGHLHRVVIDGYKAASAATVSVSVTPSVDGVDGTARTFTLPTTAGEWSAEFHPGVRRGTYYQFSLPDPAGGVAAVEVAGITLVGYSLKTPSRKGSARRF